MQLKLYLFAGNEVVITRYPFWGENILFSEFNTVLEMLWLPLPGSEVCACNAQALNIAERGRERKRKNPCGYSKDLEGRILLWQHERDFHIDGETLE